jgi:ferric iron reductase protein FhuF
MTTAVSEREPILAEVLAFVAAKASYLRAATEIDAGWHRCAGLIADPSQLTALIRQTAAGRGAPDDAVAASLFVQAYAFRVGGIPVAAQVLGLPAPATHPESTAISIARDRPNAVAFSDHTVVRRDDTDLMRQLNEEHFGPLVEAVRTELRVGERLLWGNIASSCATAMRAVDDGSDPELRHRGEALMQAASPWWQDLGQFTTVEGEARTGWYWDRTNCCLWYRTAPERWCDDCSLLDRGLLLERRLAELAEPAS